MAVQINIEGQPSKYLTAPLYTLGRAADCDVLLAENDAMVSRQHARFERDGNGAWQIVDLGSTNGTFVNGEKIQGRHALQDGDQIGIGRTQIGFASSQPSPSGISPTAPSRAAATAFVDPQDVQAAIVSAPIPSASSTPIAPPANTTVPSQPPTVNSSLDAATLPAPAQNQLEQVPADTSVTVNADAPFLPEAPLPVRKSPSSTNTASPPVTDDEMMKQCSRCRQVYSQEQQECPGCGHAGFKVKGVALTTALPTASMVVEPTPFDQQVQRNNEMRPVTPLAPVSNVSAMASHAPLIARPQAASPANTILGIAAALCGVGMLFSLFLPWAQVQMFFLSGSVSYAQLCQLALQSASQYNDLAFKAVAQEPRVLLFLLPVAATLVAFLSAAVALMGTAGSLPAAARNLSTGVILGIAGAVGLFAAFLLFFNLANVGINLTGVLGPGYWLFTLVSLAAAVVGFGGGTVTAVLAGAKIKSGR